MVHAPFCHRWKGGARSWRRRKCFLSTIRRLVRGQIRNHLSDVIDILVKGGNEVTVYPTQYAAMRYVRPRKRRKDTTVWSQAEETAHWMRW